MAYLHGTVIDKITRDDQKAIVEFIARNDGLYEFRESSEHFDEEMEQINRDGIYWRSGYESGLYQTLNEAKMSACKLISWLRSPT